MYQFLRILVEAQCMRNILNEFDVNLSIRRNNNTCVLIPLISFRCYTYKMYFVYPQLFSAQTIGMPNTLSMAFMFLFSLLSIWLTSFSYATMTLQVKKYRLKFDFGGIHWTRRERERKKISTGNKCHSRTRAAIITA